MAARIGSQGAYVSQVATGRTKVALDKLDTWADALGLTGAKRTEFIEAGQLAHAPPEIRALVIALRAGTAPPVPPEASAQIAALQAKVADLQAQLDAVAAAIRAAPQPQCMGPHDEPRHPERQKTREAAGQAGRRGAAATKVKPQSEKTLEELDEEMRRYDDD